MTDKLSAEIRYEKRLYPIKTGTVKRDKLDRWADGVAALETWKTEHHPTMLKLEEERDRARGEVENLKAEVERLQDQLNAKTSWFDLNKSVRKDIEAHSKELLERAESAESRLAKAQALVEKWRNRKVVIKRFEKGHTHPPLYGPNDDFPIYGPEDADIRCADELEKLLVGMEQDAKNGPDSGSRNPTTAGNRV